MKTVFILLIASMASIFQTNNSIEINSYQNCSAELSVEKNRSFKSADVVEGTSFMLNLKNTSSRRSTFILSTKNISSSCSNNNSNLRARTENVDTDISLYSEISRNSNLITLEQGETYSFKVNISVPEGTQYNKWSCIEVEATSNDCDSFSVKTVLSVYIPDPSEG